MAPQTPARLSAAQQRKVGRAYIAGAVHLFADGDDSVLPMFDGSPVAVPSAGSADVRSHAIGGGLVTVRPGIDGSASADATAGVRLCNGVSDSEDATACQRRLSSGRAPHWPSEFFTGVPHRQFLQVGWTSSGLQGGLDLDQPWDLSTDSRLDLRTIVDPRVGPVHLGVSLTDADGHTTVLTPLGGGNLHPLPSGGFSLAKRWGQDLRVSLAGVTDVDLSRVTQVGLVSRNASGRVFLVDLSATPDAGVSAAPTTPVPLFSIETLRQPEGDGTDRVTVDVPWHVTGNLDHDAVVTIVHATPFSFGGATQTLVIPAHTSTGTLQVRYRPNDLDDLGTRFLGLTAYAVSGLETDQYVGGVSVIDDDPTPGLTVRTGARRITAGDRATWTLTLDKPVDYVAFAVARPVKAVHGPQLRVGDLTQRFREQFLGTTSTSTHRCTRAVFGSSSRSVSTDSPGRSRSRPGPSTASPGRSRCSSGAVTSSSRTRSARCGWCRRASGAMPRTREVLLRPMPARTTVEPVTQRPHHRPLTPGDRFFSGLESGDDPVQVAEAADRAAELLVRGARASGDDAVAERVLHLADTEGIEVIAQAWAARPAESVAGCLWRLYLLRSWVYADPVGVAREFEAGRRHAAVDDVVAGVADPPGPDELRDMVDEVLRGITVGDFADVLLRAAAFARVVATGRAALADTDALAAARIQTVAEQLDRAARLELSGHLS